MGSVNPKKTIQLNTTNAICPIGEITGKKNISESKIPVLSCETKNKESSGCCA